jgi:hypothetical protein
MEWTMQRIRFVLFLAMLSYQAGSQDFSGSFAGRSDAGSAVLTLKIGAHGDYAGTLQSTAMTLAVKGTVKNNILSGTVGDKSEGLGFRAQWNGKQLSFTMFEVDERGNPIAETNETMIFQRSSDSPVLSQKTGEQGAGAVIINGVALSNEQMAEIEKAYGVRPKAGSYWYDAKSGLYGVVGYPAYGTMLPNHRFGPMKSDVSKGTTGVFINGRELPALEYAVWSYMVGSWIQPGKYWLDHQGNAGYEGNPMAVINLYVAAKQNGYRGQGGSGDNFWTSRFSAGNSDSGGQRGYVSVPGYGPVGYGF